MSANSAKKGLTIRVIVYLIFTVLLVVYVILCQYGMGFPCIFNELWGIICPSCGATRAAFSIMSGDFSAAVGYNPVFTLALYPIAAILLLQDLYISIYNVIFNKNTQSILEFLWFFRTKKRPVNQKKRGEPT